MRRPAIALALSLALAATACSTGGGGATDGLAAPMEAGYDVPPPPPTTGPYDDVFFDDPGVNPFVPTAVDNRSTFGLDVDTGSYTIARRFLEDGNLPDPASVRIEEYVNYFDQGYADPESGPFAIHVDGGTTPFVLDGGRNRIVRIGVQSRHVTESERKDAALTFVVDTSGSMGEDGRIDNVKDSLDLLVTRLRAEDTVAIVTYGDDAETLLPPTPVGERETILDAIDALETGGSTNAEAGLRLAYEHARAAYRHGAINRVVLASDGVANVGATGPDDILRSVDQEAADGIHLVTVGFGMGNYNDALMEQLADRGDGFYAYVDDHEEAERLFSQELTSTLQTLAEETKVQVEFDPVTVESYRLIGFENRAVDDDAFRDEQTPGRGDGGEIGAGHDVTALYEITLQPGAPELPDARIGTVNLRWTDPDTSTATELAQPITRRQTDVAFEDASSRFRLAVAVAAWAEVLRESPYAEQIQLEPAALVRLVDRLAGELDDPDVVELAELVQRSADLD